MADLGTEIDTDSVERSEYNGDLIPVGTIALAHVTSSEVFTPKSGQGRSLKLRWDIIDGPHSNRVIFDTINYLHSNAQTQLIAQQTIKAIREAIGEDTSGAFRDSETLHFKPVLIKVGISKPQKRDDGSMYDTQNVIKSYKRADGSSPSAKLGTPGASAQKPATQQQAAATPSRAPGRAWGNRAS